MSDTPTTTVAPTTGHSVLLVDDHDGNVRTFVDYLTAKGYHVVVARDGMEAIAHCEAWVPAIVLMDVQMPKLDGLAVTRRLRADPRFAAVPIIALTALAMPGDRERCLEAGMNEYFAKPVRLRAVLDMLVRLVGPAWQPAAPDPR